MDNRTYRSRGIESVDEVGLDNSLMIERVLWKLADGKLPMPHELVDASTLKISLAQMAQCGAMTALAKRVGKALDILAKDGGLDSGESWASTTLTVQAYSTLYRGRQRKVSTAGKFE